MEATKDLRDKLHTVRHNQTNLACELAFLGIIICWLMLIYALYSQIFEGIKDNSYDKTLIEKYEK